MTMNTSWGYNQFDLQWKPTKQLIHNLVDIVSKGGNYLLNVGPKADGTIPQASLERMAAIGKWMATNSDSIYETTASSFGKPEWGRYTTKPGIFFAHVFQWPEAGTITVATTSTQITRAYLLADKEKNDLKIEKTDEGWTIFLPENAPDEHASVIAIEHADSSP